MRQKGWVEYPCRKDFVPAPEKILLTTMPRDVFLENSEMDHLLCLTSDGKIDSFAHHPQFIPDEYKNVVKQRPYDIAFLKENVEGPLYLELPKKEVILHELETGQYDVLAISTFTWTIPWALDLAERAKNEYGIREVWMGGYGVMTPEPLIQQRFDRLFWGYGESTLLNAIGKEELAVEAIKHPELVAEITFLGHRMKVGHLFWKRGCKRNCTFCADPVFQPGGEGNFSFENVEYILDRYKNQGCVSIHLVNQEVHAFSAMGERVTKAILERNMRYSMMTSIAAINERGIDGMKLLRDRGLTLVQVGIESLSDTNLKKTRKVSDVKRIENTISILNSLGIKVAATYMICFEDDTAESIREAKKRLCNLGLVITHFNIVIPMPGTSLYRDFYERDLISDWNWSHWTGERLVWKHPTISFEEARELLAEMDSEVNTPLYNAHLRKHWDRMEMIRKRSSSGKDTVAMR